MTKVRKSYRSDVSDEEWTSCAPCLALMKEASGVPLTDSDHALKVN